MSAGVARHTHADDAQPYDFKPWDRDQAIADGPSIKAYIAETARENGIDRHIRFHHKVLDANWSSADWQWVVRVHRSDTGEEIVLRASWLFAAAGYYRYDKGFTPAFEGAQRFHGPIVHPQHWPQDLDYRDKRVVVIGSGATAVTLVPALAARAAHVTLLQRTPSYVLPVPAADPVARRLRPWLGDRLTHAATRRVNIARQRWVCALFQRYPARARKFIRSVNVRMLPVDYPVDVHFNPPYAPWEQRLCAVPGGDLFKTIGYGDASMVTDHIATFTETGIQLKSGVHSPADIIVNHRHSHRAESAAVWWPEPHGRWHRGAVRRHSRLQGHDAEWGAQYGVCHWLYVVLMDAEGGFAVRALLPVARAHGDTGVRGLYTGCRSGHGNPAVAQLRSRICPAFSRRVASPRERFPLADVVELRVGCETAAQGRSGKQAPAIHAAPHPDCPGCHSAGCGMNAASTCDRAMEALASDGDIKSVDIRQPACRQAGKAGHQADFRQSSSSGSGSARHAKLSRPSELASRVCPGQVISDTSIGRLIADFCSKALGGKLPSVECSRTLL